MNNCGVNLGQKTNESHGDFKFFERAIKSIGAREDP